jgi:hypothetical protein
LSYIIGSYSKKANSKKLQIPFAQIVIDTSKVTLAFENQLIVNFYDKNGNFNIISGTGLDEDLSPLAENDWKRLLENKTDLSRLNGHFVLIQVTSNEIKLYNDQLGLREVYFYETNDNIIFSTRLDWLVKLIKSPELDQNYLCSYWSFENPLTQHTLCKGVKLLGSAGKANIDARGLFIENTAWSPQKLKIKIDDVFDLVSQNINSLISNKGKLNLGLSGGLDSRTLLSILLNYDRKFWETHTFGQKTYYDVKIANLIARKLKIKHVHHSYKPYDADKLFGAWENFVLQTNALLPCDLYQDLSYYKLLPKNEFFIDGGKGEYLRRGLSNRLAVLGRKALIEGNIGEIKMNLCSLKPQIFNKDITKNWNLYLNNDVTQLVNTMPKPLEIGIDNWVDLYNIRYRTGNASYPSQTRLDSIVPNLMPFIQPKILSAVQNLPAKYRINENINRKILNRKRILKLFPLARYNTVVPFQYNKYSSLIWGKFMSLIFHDKLVDHKFFIETNKEFILSRLSDSDFINNPIYDKKKIKNKIAGYFSGKNNDTNFIIWWLTFDVWNRLFNK